MTHGFFSVGWIDISSNDSTPLQEEIVKPDLMPDAGSRENSYLKLRTQTNYAHQVLKLVFSPYIRYPG